jgi:hypothetical protein
LSTLEHRGISFDLPEGWTDRTVLAFTAPAKPQARYAANVVVMRDPLRPNETARFLVEQQLSDLARSARNFDILELSDQTVLGRPAVVARIGYTHPVFGDLVQEMTVLDAPPLPGDPAPMVLTITTSVAKEDEEAMRPLFARILGGMRLPPARPSGVVPRIPEEELVSYVPMPRARGAR